MRYTLLVIATLAAIMNVSTKMLSAQTDMSGRNSERFPITCLSNVADYTFMWWAYGWRGRSPEGNRVFCVQTSRYGFAFDVNHATFTHLGPIASPLPEFEAVAQSNEVIFSLPTSSLYYTLKINNRIYRSISVAPKVGDTRIIESGKFMQRIELLNLRFEDGSKTPLVGLEAWLELLCWPDRASIILHVKPTAGQVIGAMELHLAFDPALREVVPVGKFKSEVSGLHFSSPEALCLIETKGGRGGLALLNPKPNDGSVWSVQEVGGKREFALRCVYLDPPKAGEEASFAIILMPAAKGILTVCQAAVDEESHPLAGENIIAKGIAPYTKSLPVRFDRQRGWYEIALGRHDEGWNIGRDLDRMERVRVVLRNTSNAPRTVRLNFAKDYSFGGIVGMSPMIRDADGYPTGLPVQISKDWHGWVWFHGLTMLTLPPKTTVPFEFTIAYARWGGAPAASHAQLCLVGWGVNQLWDESAVGCFGESICYDPDVNLNRSMIDDIRPLMVWSMNKDKKARVKWGWTNNVGGGDFLVYFDSKGRKQWLSRMRTSYQRYCPCLTEVTYAGITADGHISARITVSTARTDDIVRGFYRLRYDVLETTPFSRLAFFQLGADNYNDHQFEMMARGDLTGLKEEWRPNTGGRVYDRTGIVCDGEQPWFSLHHASTERAKSGAWANRGLIIRSWKARLGGKDNPIPYASVYRTQDGLPSANVELSAPPNVKVLRRGDFVEADVEMIVPPMSAEDYYGPNEGLRKALAAHPNSWHIVWREAVGNALKVNLLRGQLEHSYPLRIRVGKNCRAEFTVEGGVGYVPMTFVGLSDYRGVILERNDGNRWYRVDQSVHGNDFWQTDYNPLARRWEVTFTVPLDSLDDHHEQVHFRLRCE